MGTHRVQCDTWDEVKIKLWDIIHHELKSLAASTGTPPVWTFDEQDPAIEMFEKYTSMRMNTKMLDPWTSAKGRRYLMKNQHESVLLSVYKYGNEIAIIGQLRDFEDQCIGPAAANRGGAAAEDLHQLMISSLKEKWGRRFTAQDMSWRLWASLVLKKPRPQHEREIAKGPPPNLVTQFRPASNASDQHLQRVQHSVKMAKKAVQGMQAKINHFEQTVQVLQTAIVFMNQMLENHLDVIEAMGEDVEIQPDSIETTAALADIPNQEDVDHN
ncbi:feruloyl esterase B-2 [Phytophthora nicotianae]|nr:feruloyl esterase B-2 [Phytophthora nicotianae]